MVDKTSLVLAFFVAALLAGLFMHFGKQSGPSPARENFMQQQVGAPVSGPGMGPYDAVSMGPISGWASTEPHSAAPIVAGGLPSLADDNKLMLLVGNKTDPSCCPSAFNTDTGCVCLTDSDRSLMASRGGNRA
jgi:hypothetical protein